MRSLRMLAVGALCLIIAGLSFLTLLSQSTPSRAQAGFSCGTASIPCFVTLSGGGSLPSGAATSANQNSTAAGTSATNAQGVQGVTNGVPLPIAGSTGAALSQTTSNALQPATAASGKITLTSTPLSANTNTQIAAANTSRIALGIQCAGSAAVNVSETGATLAAATFGATGATIQIPAGSTPYFSPPIATLTAITAYSGTAQSCVVTEYNR